MQLWLLRITQRRDVSTFGRLGRGVAKHPMSNGLGNRHPAKFLTGWKSEKNVN